MLSYLNHCSVIVTMATDHTHHVVGEEVMGEGVRGGGGEEGRLVHFHRLLAEHGASYSGRSYRERGRQASITCHQTINVIWSSCIQRNCDLNSNLKFKIQKF